MFSILYLCCSLFYYFCIFADSNPEAFSSGVCYAMPAVGLALPNLIITFFTRPGSAVIMTFCPVSLEIRQKLIGKKRTGKKCTSRQIFSSFCERFTRQLICFLRCIRRLIQLAYSREATLNVSQIKHGG